MPAFIVVADDEKAIAELLCDMFEDEGYGVHCCYSGNTAYEAIEKHIPDIVILDMQMEKRASGLEVVQRMRANPTLHDIPVIIYSADYGFLGEVRDRLVAHRCQILHKPFDIAVLLDMVAEAVNLRERQVSVE